MKRKSDVLGTSHAQSEKRLKTTDPQKSPLHLRFRQRNARALVENPQDKAIFDQEMARSICVALYGVGFDGAMSSALESFESAVEEYIYRFAQKIKTSMQHNRRESPLPQDFIHALSQFNIVPSSLSAEYELQIPPQIVQAPVLQPTPDLQLSRFTIPVFSDSDDIHAPGAVKRTYVPKHFPDFPAEHTYRESPVYALRETDTLRIRELAADEGKQAEAALQKLMIANKVANGREGKIRGRWKSPEMASRGQELWKAAMTVAAEEDLRRAKMDADDDVEGMSGTAGTVEVNNAMDGTEGHVMAAVNYDRTYWRRGISNTRLIT